MYAAVELQIRAPTCRASEGNPFSRAQIGHPCLVLPLEDDALVALDWGQARLGEAASSSPALGSRETRRRGPRGERATAQGKRVKEGDAL